MQDYLLAYKDKFYRFALRLVDNEFDAEDIMQELAIKIWELGEDFEKIENKDAWCMTVTRNMALDKIRSNHKRHHESMDNINLNLNETPGPDKEYESNDIMTRIRNLMKNMPETYKTVIQLREIEEMSYKEIADIMNTDIQNVKVYIFRARKQLQELIKESGIKYN